MPAPRASATAAPSPGAPGACTASSAWHASRSARSRAAGKFRDSPRRAGEGRRMSMTDPIADLLTRIRNGQTAGKSEIQLASSKLKTAIVKVLKDEGYVADFRTETEGGKPTLTIGLKYYEGRPVIDRIERV